jgi:hypothetical protein
VRPTPTLFDPTPSPKPPERVILLGNVVTMADAETRVIENAGETFCSAGVRCCGGP